MDNQPKKTNGLCIAGLICSFLIAPLGLILSIIGVIQTKKNNEDGKVMGIIGIVVGAISTILQIIVIVFAMLMFIGVVSEVSSAAPDFEGIIRDSRNEISRHTAESYLETACSNLVKGEYSFTDNEEYSLVCKNYVCTLKTGDKTYTRSCGVRDEQ